MSNVTSGTASEGPFNGTWEQSMVGWASTDSPCVSENPDGVGTVDTAPTGLVAIGSMTSVSIFTGSSPGYSSETPVVIIQGAGGATLASLGTVIKVVSPAGVSRELELSAADFSGYCSSTGSSEGGQGAEYYPTAIFVSTDDGNEFIASEVTVVEGVVNINLQGEAAGNAGSDVLLQWSAPNCNDTQFQIVQNGSVVETIPAINNGNNVFAGQATDFNYAYAIAQLTPNTEYAFSVTGDANGGSNTVDVTTGCRGVEIFNCDCSIEPVQQTLAELRTRVMVRLGYPNQAANPPPGMSALVDAFLYDAQKLIWKQLSRAGLNVERFFRWIMVPGQRYYGIDANADKCDLKLDPYKIVWAGFEDLNEAWYRLTEGIPPEYYTRANINFGWPTHYEVRSCIEIFPAPQAPYTLWIKGDFGLAPFTADTDTATIDDQAVFLLALGMAKAHYGQKDTASVLAQADTYVRGLVAGLHGTRRYVPRTKVQNPATPPRFLPLGDAQA